MEDDNRQYCVKWRNHQNTVFTVFQSLLERESLVDCTIATEGKYLKVHKVVISACSPFLEALLSEHNDKHPIIMLKDIKFSELESLISFIYRGEVNVESDQIMNFLQAAESLEIKGIVNCYSKDDSQPATNHRSNLSDVSSKKKRKFNPHLDVAIPIEGRNSSKKKGKLSQSLKDNRKFKSKEYRTLDADIAVPFNINTEPIPESKTDVAHSDTNTELAQHDKNNLALFAFNTERIQEQANNVAIPLTVKTEPVEERGNGKLSVPTASPEDSFRSKNLHPGGCNTYQSNSYSPDSSVDQVISVKESCEQMESTPELFDSNVDCDYSDTWDDEGSSQHGDYNYEGLFVENDSQMNLFEDTNSSSSSNSNNAKDNNYENKGRGRPRKFPNDAKYAAEKRKFSREEQMGNDVTCSTWLSNNYESCDDASVATLRESIYEEYLRFCEDMRFNAVNSANFGKCLRKIFPNVFTRRLVVENVGLKYHYGGIRKKNCDNHETPQTIS